MMNIPMPVVACALSTILFVASVLPMLHKAFRSKDLRSYSPEKLLLTNTANIVHSIYVYSLPLGPIWVLHTIHLASIALMLAWYLQYEWFPRDRCDDHAQNTGKPHLNDAIGLEPPRPLMRVKLPRVLTTSLPAGASARPTTSPAYRERINSGSRV